MASLAGSEEVLWLLGVPSRWSWEVSGWSLGVLGRVPGVSGESLGVSGGVSGRPRGLLGEGVGGTENTDGFLRVSGGGPGGSLGCFWSSGVVLGTDLGDGNVHIFLMLVVILQRCFCWFKACDSRVYWS